jgi:hypothetical protein
MILGMVYGAAGLIDQVPGSWVRGLKTAELARDLCRKNRRPLNGLSQ